MSSAQLTAYSYKCFKAEGASRLNSFTPEERKQAMPHAVPFDRFFCFAGGTPNLARYLTAFHLDSGTLFVAFRGTKSLTDVLVDVNAFMKTVSWTEDGNPVRVHSGFLTLFQNTFMPRGGFEGFAHDIICQQLSIKPEQVRAVVLSGHSMGGAIALLSAYNWSKARQVETGSRMRFRDDTKLHVSAFGTPAVGNKAFVDDFFQQNISYFNLVNRKDWIAQVSTWDQNPKHWLKAQVVNDKYQSIDWEAEDHPPSSPVTRDWVTDEHIPVYWIKADQHLFLDRCRQTNVHPELKELPALYRYLSGSCFPPWPPVGKAKKYKNTVRLYDQYAPTLPEDVWIDFLKDRPRIQVDDIRKYHSMKTYFAHMVHVMQTPSKKKRQESKKNKG